MNTTDYFIRNREITPSWLKNYKIGNKINFDEVFKSRIVYYPGSLFDGQPIKTYNNAHLSHTFIYSDYGVTKDRVYNELSNKDALLGYNLLDIKEINKDDIISNNITYHFSLSTDDIDWINSFRKDSFFSFIAIYERKSDFDETHGAKRIALIYIGDDGIKAYDELFINKNITPYVLVLQDHGFGGNYNYFGRYSKLNEISIRTNIYPEYLLCASNTNEWKNYNLISEVDKEIGGMYHHERYLYKLIS